MPTDRPVTYGEFPHLFEGFPPDAPVDLDDRWTLGQLRTFGDRAVVRALMTEERTEMMDAPIRAREEDSRRLLKRLREVGLADPDMGTPDPER